VSRTFDTALPPLSASEDEGVGSRSVEEVYAEHAPFVWRSLRALGVPPASVDDALQDVFVVVHRKLATFRGPAQLRTWLFAIARRVASHYRRAAGRAQRTEAIDEAAPIVDTASTFDEASRNEAAALLVEVLAELDEAKRELLILVELEQLPVPDVAAHLDVPLNTAYSRLRLARKAFTAALAKRRSKGTSR
jgi:RNA polymerase sigma-70 factor (ECF subfamily)